MSPSWRDRFWKSILVAVVGLILFHIALIVGAVAVNSFGQRWFGTWLPEGMTFGWYREAWQEFQLGDVLMVTLEVVFAVVALSLALGVPAAYALARRDFVCKRWLMLLFVLPLIIPPITYGIPLAAVMYKMGLGGTLAGVIVANTIPALAFVVLVMTPFIEQLDPNLESAARIFGADTRRVFWHILLPQLRPGMLAAALLVMVRTIAMFELTFLTAGPDSQTLVVALYYAVFAAGVRASQSVDAMAMVYMVMTMMWVLIALRFVNPTQLVSRVKQSGR